MWADTVRYYFNSKELGKELVPEPKNYKDGNGAKYKRDPKSKGIMRKNSNELEFIGKGYEYLLKINSLYGVVPDVRVDKWYKDPNRLDQRWTYLGSFGLDITNLEFDHDKKTVKASYTNGGLADKLQSRLNENYDLIETTGGTDGVDIGALQTVNCNLPGKAIFLESKLVIEQGERVHTPITGGDKDAVRAIPFQVETNPEGEQFNNDRANVYSITSPPLGFNNGNFTAGDEGAITYLNSDRAKRLKLTGRVNFDFYDTDTGLLDFGILIYENGIDLDYKEFILIQQINTNGSQKIDHTFTNYELDILEGESFTLAYKSRTDDGFGVEYLEGNTLSIIDEDPAPPTITRALTFKMVFDRLMARAFGEHDLVESELLTTGEFAETLKANGLFIRQFPDVVNEGTEEERRVQFKTSLKKQFDSANAIRPIAYWVAKSGDKEVLRIEKLEYTQQDFVGIHYGEKLANGKWDYIPVQKLKRKVLSGNYYSSAQVGSTSSGENYENFFGLTSFCGNVTYSFINDSKGVPYVAVTEDRTGDLDIEIIRRKPFDKFPDEDTNMDDDLLFIDAKKLSNGTYTVRTWQDDFSESPKNVYRPDTAFNFRYQPERLLLNHSFVLNAGLFHYPQEYARWASSNCNSSLVTKLIGDEELQGSKPIPHTRLKKNKVRPMLPSFEMVVPLEVEKQINGFQPNGVPNWFGRVAVLVEGNIEYMRLVDVDTNKQGKHQNIEAA